MVYISKISSNINKATRTYLIGRSYLLEKNKNGVYDHSKSTINKLPQNEGASETAVLIENK